MLVVLICKNRIFHFPKNVSRAVLLKLSIGIADFAFILFSFYVVTLYFLLFFLFVFLSVCLFFSWCGGGGGEGEGRGRGTSEGLFWFLTFPFHDREVIGIIGRN